MTAPSPPLRVLVVGASMTYMVVPPRAGPGDGSYPQHLRQFLADRGCTAEVTMRARWYGRVDEHLRRFEEGIRDRLPDVVVLDIGEGSSHPRVIPNWLTRHLLTWDRSSRLGARTYRRLVDGPVWRALRTLQRLAVGRAPLALSRLSPRRFRHDAARLVDLIRTETGAAVVAVGLDPPGSRVLHWLPGLDERYAHYDHLLQDVVRAADDPGVVYVARAVDAERVPVDELLPDGLHRTAAGHRMLAERLTDAVLEVVPHARTARPARSTPTTRTASPNVPAPTPRDGADPAGAAEDSA